MQGMRKRPGTKDLKPSLAADESGMALVYVTIMLPVIIGFACLAIDVARFQILNSSLQHGADSLALAGAAELDGRTDAIARSDDAIKQFVTNNKALFTSSTATLDWSTVTTCYLSSLPADDATPINTADCLDKALPTSSQTARFVRVKVDPKNYKTIFPVNIIGQVASTAKTSAEAVAGFQAAVCNFTPVFMCNPYEPTTGVTTSFNDYGLIAAAGDPEKRKAAIKLVEVASSGTVTAVPGNFGYLDPVSGKGKKGLEVEIASIIPDGCYIIDNLSTTKPGGMTSLLNAFNTRFDNYKGTLSKKDYPPAMNVRKGYSGSGCAATANTDTTKYMGMPVDSCFATSTCPKSNIGNGDWKYDPVAGTGVSFQSYWDVNFTGSGKSAPSPKDLGLGVRTTSYTGAETSTGSGKFDTPPRYDVYKYENTTPLPSSPSKMLSSYARKPSGESGDPSCGTGTSTVDRRIIYGAVINCNAEKLEPGKGGYHAFAFAKFFMIRPMTDPPDATLWVELVDVVRPGDGTGIARDVVQLYR
jgi:Flp pilus assembly protein TadG